MANTEEKNALCASRMNKVGGQAVMEGVMMKAGDRTVTTCRKEDGSLVVFDDVFTSVRKKHKILNLPLIRGVVNFVEMMKLSIKTMESSAEALGIEEEETKFEIWMKKHLGLKLTDVVMVIATVLGVLLSLGLFLALPRAVASLIPNLENYPVYKSLVEGGSKVVIFLLYLFLISLVPDIKRVFMYHGAEHKSIACFEAGGELTPENAKNYTRFHPRCGTSFMFFMILIGVVVGIFINTLWPGLPNAAYVGIRLLLLPLVVGIGYEFILYAGKHCNLFTRALSAPGLWVQRLTTKEPELDMLEVAITSIKVALRDSDPAFMAFYEEKGWEKKEAAPDAADADAVALEETQNGEDVEPAEPVLDDRKTLE